MSHPFKAMPDGEVQPELPFVHDLREAAKFETMNEGLQTIYAKNDYGKGCCVALYSRGCLLLASFESWPNGETREAEIPLTVEQMAALRRVFLGTGV